jgi:hypothetical protein
MRLALEPALAVRGVPDPVDRLAGCLLGRRPEVLAAVADVIAADPGATGAAVCAVVGYRRQDVLDAVRALRAVREPFPEADGRLCAPPAETEGT